MPCGEREELSHWPLRIISIRWRITSSEMSDLCSPISAIPGSRLTAVNASCIKHPQLQTFPNFNNCANLKLIAGFSQRLYGMPGAIRNGKICIANIQVPVLDCTTTDVHLISGKHFRST